MLFTLILFIFIGIFILAAGSITARCSGKKCTALFSSLFIASIITFLVCELTIFVTYHNNKPNAFHTEEFQLYTEIPPSICKDGQQTTVTAWTYLSEEDRTVRMQEFTFLGPVYISETEGEETIEITYGFYRPATKFMRALYWPRTEGKTKIVSATIYTQKTAGN